MFAPNLLLSTSIAKFKLSGKREDRKEILDDQFSKVNGFISLIHEYACDESPRILKTLYEFEAEGLFILGLILYPTLVKLILMKLEADKTYGKLMDHSLFQFNEDDEVLEHSLGLDSDVLNKYFDLYVERTFECYKDDDILAWIKQVIKFVVEQIDSGELDRDVMFQFIFSAVGLPYELKRYSKLSKEFFNDDFTTVNPQELMAGGNGAMGGMNPEEMANAIGGGMDNAAMQEQVQAQIEQMMANNQVPPEIADMVRNAGHQNMPPVDPDNLIIEDPDFIHEQELIMNHIAQQPAEEEDILILDSGDAEVHKQQEEDN